MRKLWLLSALLLGQLFTANCFAQAGSLSLGLRATPDGGGFTAKYFFDPNLALEGQLNAGGIMGGGNGTSVSIVGLVEYHISLPDPAWRLYFGGGVHAGSWDRGVRYSNLEGRFVSNTEAIFGIDGIGGVEYLFRTVPLGLTADFKPAINFLTDVDFFPHNMFGLGARLYIR